MRNRDIERQIRETADTPANAFATTPTAPPTVRRACSSVVAAASTSVSASAAPDYGRQMSHAAEDFADEANYHYRRLRRQVNRHPAATVAIVAGTVGAFLLLRRAFRSDDEE